MSEQNKSKLDYTLNEINNGLDGGLSYKLEKNNFLTKDEASQNYLTQANAENIYLTQTEAENIYLTQAEAEDTYLTQTEAENTYLKLEDYSESLIQNLSSRSPWTFTNNVNSNTLQFKIISLGKLAYYVNGYFSLIDSSNSGREELEIVENEIDLIDNESTLNINNVGNRDGIEGREEEINDGSSLINEWIQIAVISSLKYPALDNSILQAIITEGTSEQKNANLKIKIINKNVYFYTDTDLTGATIQFSGIYS